MLYSHQKTLLQLVGPEINSIRNKVHNDDDSSGKQSWKRLKRLYWMSLITCTYETGKSDARVHSQVEIRHLFGLGTACLLTNFIKASG